MRRWLVAVMVGASALGIAAFAGADGGVPPPPPPFDPALLPAEIPVAGPDGRVVGYVSRDEVLGPVPPGVPDAAELRESARRLVSPPTTWGGG
jgi:hypothetical protein